MKPENFLKTLHDSNPPENISLYLKALWFDAKGNWEEAHRLIQDEPGVMPGRIHAYLHRKEGDEFNAGYWYRRAGVAPFTGSLDAEWQLLLLDCSK